MVIEPFTVLASTGPSRSAARIEPLTVRGTNRTPAGADAVTLLDSLYEKPVRADLPKGL